MPNALVKRLGALPSRDDSADMVVRKLERMSAVKRAVKDWSQQMEAGICAWIEDHGDLEIPGASGVRYYIGEGKRIRCIDPAKAFIAMLEAAGGDVAAVALAISANGIKQGAAKVILGSEWDKHFVMEKTEGLREGKSKKLKRFDPKYPKYMK